MRPANRKSTDLPSLRALPSVDELMRAPEMMSLRDTIGLAKVTNLARVVTEGLRKELLEAHNHQHSAPATREELMREAVIRLQQEIERERKAAIQRVINATGVVIHTNLGRAPLSAKAREKLLENAGYCSIEYEVIKGNRGRRGAHAEELLIDLTGAEDALVVNNCAAAALLILTVLAKDGETIVSRGELVEIGGDFRVPDVMANSGTRMIEVGTTNRTKLDDYRRGISERTRLIMRVHPSNYRIVGFTAAPSIADLSDLAHSAGLPLYEDAGSGVLRDLSSLGLSDEPVIGESLANGADVVSFSGDKLLGAGQAGLIVGRADIIRRLRSHALYRALRADKLSLSVLEATLDSHRRGVANDEVPVLRMIAQTAAQIGQRVNDFVEAFRRSGPSMLELVTVEGVSAIGGGSGPSTHPPTVLLALNDTRRSPDELAQALRLGLPPVITRIADGRVLLDLRTVDSSEEKELLTALMRIGS